MDMSNSDEINSFENQQLPTFKDPKRCLDITTNHQKHEDDKKIVMLHQDPKECQDIIMDDQNDDDAEKIIVLHQDPKGCQDITMCHKKDDDTKTTIFLHQNPKGCQDITMDHQKYDDTNKIEILQQDPKGCQGDVAQDHPQEDDVVNKIIALQHVEKEVLPEDDDDGFRTPTSLESKIPILTTCPPAPKPKYSGMKRKASSPRRGIRTIRVWIDYRHRDTGRFWPENQENNNTIPRRIN